MSKLLPIAQWAEEIGKTERWVRDHINTGEILAVKVGSSYFVSDELFAAMAARAIPSSAAEPLSGEGWGQITRSAS